MPLSRPCIEFMHEPALPLKTTIAQFLGTRFDVTAISTHVFGPAMRNGSIDPSMREDRCQNLLAHAAPDIARGTSGDLDGRFSGRRHRASIYALARNHQAHVIAIKTVCDSRTEIEQRARQRAADLAAPDRDFSSIAIHERTAREVAQFPIERDPDIAALGADILAVYTGNRRYVRCPTDASADAQRIARMLRELVGS